LITSRDQYNYFTTTFPSCCVAYKYPVQSNIDTCNFFVLGNKKCGKSTFIKTLVNGSQFLRSEVKPGNVHTSQLEYTRADRNFVLGQLESALANEKQQIKKQLSEQEQLDLQGKVNRDYQIVNSFWYGNISTCLHELSTEELTSDCEAANVMKASQKNLCAILFNMDETNEIELLIAIQAPLAALKVVENSCF